MTKIRKAVIPVGGLGTRFLPATKSVPKEMLPVACKPIVQYAYEETREAGIEECVFITGRHKYAINAHFDRAPELQTALMASGKEDALEKVRSSIPEDTPVAYIPQHEPKGLGHAVWCARHFVGDEPFALLLPDEMFLHSTGVLKQMTDMYAQFPGSNLITVDEVPRERVSSYGIIAPGGEGPHERLTPITDMAEKPAIEHAPSRMAITGRYILQPEIFGYLKHATKGAGGEIQITDSLREMLAVQPFYGYRFEGRRFDCGTMPGFLEANIAYALENPDMRGYTEEVIRKYGEMLRDEEKGAA